MLLRKGQLLHESLFFLALPFFDLQCVLFAVSEKPREQLPFIITLMLVFVRVIDLLAALRSFNRVADADDQVRAISVDPLVRNRQVQLVHASVFFLLKLDGLVELMLCEGGLHILNADEVDLARGEVVRDGAVDFPEQELERGNLDVEEVQAEHGDQVVDETREVDLLALVDRLAGHVVV